MGDSLRTLAEGLPETARPLLTTRPDAEHRIPDLADRLAAALDAPRAFADDLRREAEARFDWRAIAERLADELAALGAPLLTSGGHAAVGPLRQQQVRGARNAPRGRPRWPCPSSRTAGCWTGPSKHDVEVGVPRVGADPLDDRTEGVAAGPRGPVRSGSPGRRVSSTTSFPVTPWRAFDPARGQQEVAEVPVRERDDGGRDDTRTPAEKETRTRRRRPRCTEGGGRESTPSGLPARYRGVSRTTRALRPRRRRRGGLEGHVPVGEAAGVHGPAAPHVDARVTVVGDDPADAGVEFAARPLDPLRKPDDLARLPPTRSACP